VQQKNRRWIAEAVAGAPVRRDPDADALDDVVGGAWSKSGAHLFILHRIGVRKPARGLRL
jgi:hypothetical protein